MFIRAFIILLTLSCCISCRPQSDEDSEPPAYVLEEQTFVKILTECYLGEGAVGVNVKNVRGEQFDSAYQFNPFKDNGITKEQFDTTVAYYSQHPKHLKLIYEKILANLSQIQAAGNLEGKQMANSSVKIIQAKPTDYVHANSLPFSSTNGEPAGYSSLLPYLM
jgi:hypothetical protein